MKVTDNFTLEEFYCKDGTPVPMDHYDRIQELAENLQVLRDHIGKPIHINSAYRTPEYNAKIGGVKNSQHVQCRAADITVRDMSPSQVYATIEKLIQAGKMKNGGLGKYKGFTHYDIHTVRRWKG